MTKQELYHNYRQSTLKHMTSKGYGYVYKMGNGYVVRLVRAYYKIDNEEGKRVFESEDRNENKRAS